MPPNTLPLSRCAFYRVGTRKRLAKVLFLSPSELTQLAAAKAANYRQYQRVMGVGKAPRWIETPKPALKKVQRRIHDLLIRMHAPPFLFSGVPRRSAVNNAQRHSINVPMVKLDVTSFFPNSDGRRVYRFFHETMKCPPDVAGLLCDLTTLSTASAPDWCHLPTGGVTSQILAYYAYRGMFKELSDLADRTGTVFSVMVDDLTFSGPGATEALLNEARLILRRHGLQSKRKREKAWRSGETKSVTGVVITRHGYRLPQSRRIKIHQLHAAVKQSRTPVEKAQNIQRLAGALFSAGPIESQFDEQGHALMRRVRADQPLWTEFCRLGATPKQVEQKSKWPQGLSVELRQEKRLGDIVTQMDELVAEGLIDPVSRAIVEPTPPSPQPVAEDAKV